MKNYMPESVKSSSSSLKANINSAEIHFMEDELYDESYCNFCLD